MRLYYIVGDHSKWGPVRLIGEVREHSFPELPGYTWVLSYPDGSFMGERDHERGGLLLHPNSEVQRFITTYNSIPDLYVLDSAAYKELEYIIDSEIQKNDPHFFSEEVLPLKKC